MIHQAIVAAEGRGTRLGALSKRYGNKSLVPIAGTPIIRLTVDWLLEAGISSVILAVNFRDSWRQLSFLFQDSAQVAVHYVPSKSGSFRCLPPLAKILEERFIFAYGHAPAPPQHLRAMSRCPGVVVSLYPTTTQEEERAKRARLRDGVVRLDEEGPLFIEPPHILTSAAFLVRGEVSWKELFESYDRKISGVRAIHPPEFHYHRDFLQTRRYLLKEMERRYR